jgi:hypothetical protein
MAHCECNSPTEAFPEAGEVSRPAAAARKEQKKRRLGQPAKKGSAIGSPRRAHFGAGKCVVLLEIFYKSAAAKGADRFPALLRRAGRPSLLTAAYPF